MENKLPIGKLLQNAGIVTAEQIDVALDVQRINGKVLGEILVDLDFVTSAEIAETVAMQNKLSFINLDSITPTNEALALVPGQLATSRNILPLYIENDTLTLVSDGSPDLMTQDYLKKESGKKLNFVVSDKKKISKLIQIFYHQLQNPIEDQVKRITKKASEGAEIDISQLLTLLLNCAIKDRATDIHISPNEDITFVSYRIDGVLRTYFSFPTKIHSQLVSKIKIMSDLDISEQRKPQDGNASYEFYNDTFELRVSTSPTIDGENVVVRLLDKSSSLFSLKNLGFSDANIKKIEHYFSKPYGIILVTGPTGSGKTTTLYAAMRKINPLHKNIMTAEDPVEYKFSFIRQTQIHQKSGYTFSTALKTFMRQDPDVMLIGEIRDAETAELGIRASITGHLVLSTLHTNDAVGAIPRLDDLGVPSYLIGSALLAVIGQRLARKLCDHCKMPIDVSNEELIGRGIPQSIVDEYSSGKIYKAVGCEHCKNYGYSGRVAIIEIFEINEAIENLITEKATTLHILKVAKEQGMTTMREDGYIKALQGFTTLEEIDRVVN